MQGTTFIIKSSLASGYYRVGSGKRQLPYFKKKKKKPWLQHFRNPCLNLLANADF